MRVNNFENNKLKIIETLSVHPDIEAKYARSRPKAGDVLITLVGSIGQIAIAPDEIEGWNLARAVGLIPTRNIEDAKWIYFALQAPEAQQYMLQRANTTVQTTFNLGDLTKLPIPVPHLSERRTILEVLSSLDDKIELNRRKNETLEAMAQAIFKDWFVDFGPVRRKMQGETDPIAILGGLIENPVNAGPLAALFPDNLGVNNLPEGWGISTLEEYLEIRRGGSPRPIKDFISDVGFPWMKIADATSLTSPFVFQTRERIKVEGLSKTVKLQQGSLILSNSATPGLPKFLMLEACIHDGWLYFPKIEKLPLEFLYVFFLHIRKELVSRGNGSVFTNLKTDIVKAFEFPDAPIAIFDAYRKLVAPLFAKILLSDREIRTLAETRDYLLPKLMSGEIRAGDLELVG